MVHPSYMRDWGATLCDNGYRILPLWPGEKRPGRMEGGIWKEYPGWQKHCTRETKRFELSIWERWDGCGIGIACGETVIGVDLDIRDAGLAIKVQELAAKRLGPTPAIRVGQHPKALLVYRVTKPFETFKRRPIEILGLGAQFVAYGVHPDTGKPYQWIDEGLCDVDLRQLPAVERDQVEAFVEEALALLPEVMKSTPRKVSNGETTAASVHGATATLDAVKGAVEAIPNPDLQWDDWSRIGMAIWAATRGSEKGYSAFSDWSAKSGKHQDEAARERWDHWQRSPPSKLGFGSLCYEAQAHGWVPPAGLVFDEFTASLPPAQVLVKQVAQAKPAEPATPRGYSVPSHLLDLDGGLKAFVDWCTATAPRPQPFLALAAALPLFGVLTGRRYQSRSGLRGNVYTVGIADSGGGKDHARKAVVNLLFRAGLGAYAGGDDLGSGQAILGALHKHPALLFRSDEFGKQLQGWTNRRAPSHKADIWTKLTILYGSADGVVQGTEYANQRDRPRQDIVQPCVCFMGTTVPGPFWDALQEGALSDGSLARFLVFRSGEDYPEWRLDVPALEPPQGLIEICQAITEGAEGHDYGGNLAGLMDPLTAPTPYTVPEEPGATKILDALALQTTEWLRQTDSQAKKALAARLRENAIKLAMIRAVARIPGRPIITERDARWAADLAEHCLDTVIRDADRYVADNDTEADVKRLLAIIQDAGEEGITRSLLTRKAQRIDRRKRAEHLATLEEAQLIARVVIKAEGKGRSGERYIAADFLQQTSSNISPEEEAITH